MDIKFSHIRLPLWKVKEKAHSECLVKATGYYNKRGEEQCVGGTHL